MKMKIERAALASGPPTESRRRISVAQDQNGVRLDFLTDAPPAPAEELPDTRNRSAAFARVLRARAALRRAEAAVALPFTKAASIAIDAALVALEAAQAELHALDEADPNDE
jgi:hypothetical protein